MEIHGMCTNNKKLKTYLHIDKCLPVPQFVQDRYKCLFSSEVPHFYAAWPGNLLVATNPGNSHFRQKFNIYLASDWLLKTLKMCCCFSLSTAVAYFSILFCNKSTQWMCSTSKYISRHLKCKLENEKESWIKIFLKNKKSSFMKQVSFNTLLHLWLSPEFAMFLVSGDPSLGFVLLTVA